MTLRTVSVKRGLIFWVISALLMAPAAWPYFTHYFVKRDNLLPTGFIHADMPSYMANAREHFDAGHFRLTFSNPASVSYDSPPIYFQPLILILAIVWRVTGLSPGIVFMLSGIVTALLCAGAALALYREVIGLKRAPENLGLVVFFWGGGLLALTGAVYKIAGNRGSVFQFDPADGWWFLNFGRNLILPTEALYHAVFLGCILCIVKRSYRAAVILAFAASVSHPFTGIELLAILCTWSLVEIYFMQNDEVPKFFLFACIGLMAGQFAYYVFFLNLFPEHRALSAEWALPWLLQAEHFIPAYALVGGLAVARLRRCKLAGEVLRIPTNRLFLIWFLVAFGLANHEFAIAPRQPLHFTRGYCWIALFLLGAPVLVKVFRYVLSGKVGVLGPVACVVIVALFLSDNILWFGSFVSREDQGMRLTQDQSQLLDWLNILENRRYVVVSKDPELGHMVIVYTPLRAWLSHWETPLRRMRQAEVNAFFEHGDILEHWQTLPLLFVFAKADHNNGQAAWPSREPDFQNRSFAVFRHCGGAASAHHRGQAFWSLTPCSR